MNEKEIWENLHKNDYNRFIPIKTMIKSVSEECEKILNKDMIALDIGCGSGNSTLFLTKYVRKVYGIDISEECIRKTKETFKNMRDMIFVVGNGKDLSNFKNDMFDFIFSCSVFIHIPREFTKNYLKESKRVLKNGGYILVNISSNTELNELEMPKVNLNFGPEPHIGWKLDDMKKFLTDELKLDLIKVKYIGNGFIQNYYFLLKKKKKESIKGGG